MKIQAPSKDSIQLSLQRYGLTEDQVIRFLPRILLLLDWIGPAPKRVNSNLFRYFADKITVKKKRTNLLTVLKKSKIMRCTSKHIQNVRSSEYRIKGPFIEQEIGVSKDDLERLQKAQRELGDSNTSNTLKWLNKTAPHQFYSGSYICKSIPNGWHTIGLNAADAALLYTYIDSKIRHPSVNTDRFKNEFFFQALNYFYKSAQKSLIESFSEDTNERTEYKRMIDQWRFQHEFLQKLSSDRCELINSIVKELSASSTLLACDGCTLYSPNKELLQKAFCNWVLRTTSVDLTGEVINEWVLSKALHINDIRNMVVPYINDAIEPLEREIAFKIAD